MENSIRYQAILKNGKNAKKLYKSPMEALRANPSKVARLVELRVGSTLIEVDKKARTL